MKIITHFQNTLQLAKVKKKFVLAQTKAESNKMEHSEHIKVHTGVTMSA